MLILKNGFLFLSFCLLTLWGHAQDKPAYSLFNAKGKKTSYKKMLQSIAKADVIFFGEMHYDPIAHWLQFELIKDAFQNHASVQIGGEMFENHQQWALDLYQAGKIGSKTFEDTVKWWNNYPTDYAPIVDFAVQNKIPVFATNIPRIYARTVARHGQAALDTVPPERRGWLVPLPYEVDFELPTYKVLLGGGGGHGSEMPTMQAKNFVSAQAIKDATMAFRIHSTFKAGSKYFHLNGAYHSDFKEGIIWYLRRHNPKLRILNISTVYQEQLTKLNKEHLKRADFVITVPATMTQTQKLRF